MKLDKQSRLYAGTILILVIIISVLIVMLYKKSGETSHNTHQEQSSVSDEVIQFDAAQIKQAGIEIEHAKPELVSRLIRLSGEIKLNEDRTAHVVPRVAGIVESVAADMGQQVSKGQTLAVISSMQLAELRSAFLSAQKRKELAQITYDREKELWKDKISSEQDYLQAKENLSEANIALNNAVQKMVALGASKTTNMAVSSYELRAPFNGTIVEKHLTQGEAIKEDVNVFTITDLSTVWAEINVPALDFDLVRVGEKVLVKALSLDSKSEGTVTFVGSLFGEQTRTAKARVTLANPELAWRPGLLVDVELTGGGSQSKAAIAVKSDAIQTIENHPTVFVQVEGGFVPQPVVVGRSDGQFSEIKEGLKEGTPYAAAGSFVIKAEMGKGEASHAH